MERPKLKLTVIILLALLNIFLLGLVVMQNAEAKAYKEENRTQAISYLESHGIRAEEGIIPWKSVLLDPPDDPARLLLEKVPAKGSTVTWEILPMRQPETLVVDFVRGLTARMETCTQIESIEEGYRSMEIGSRAILTPVWVITTDGGVYRMNCATGDLTKEE
ncbi:MAG: hypothetical protein HUJ67_04380 [Ruminiclostridium sp.]|nr:hypothetical protein [Ruminiclostridium sp.]